MADSPKGKNGKPGAKTAGAGENVQPIQAQVVGQFIKDLSFENPSAGKPVETSGEAPNLSVEVNVQASRVGPDLYESGIELKALAKGKTATIYHLEIVYAGLFKIQNIPEPALEPFVLVNCPTLIFPFLRRIVADVTRDGGFPPLLLDPIDFALLYMRRQNEKAQAAASTKQPH